MQQQQQQQRGLRKEKSAERVERLSEEGLLLLRSSKSGKRLYLPCRNIVLPLFLKLHQIEKNRTNLSLTFKLLTLYTPVSAIVNWSALVSSAWLSRCDL